MSGRTRHVVMAFSDGRVQVSEAEFLRETVNVEDDADESVMAAAGGWHAAPVARPAVDPAQVWEVTPFQKVFALEEFPEETQAWVAAVEQGIPLRIDLGDGDILHVRQNEAGDWEMERENLASGTWHCTVENGISRTQGEEVLVAYAEENWERISITPEVAASDGRDPLTGELTMAERRIPYGQQYAASLRSMLGLMVWERVGANSESNIASRTAILLTLAASLNAIYENQIGLNYVLQEIILLVDGTDWEDSRLIYDGSKDSWRACLQTFGTWLGFHRPQTTRHWTVATKIGRVKNANGWAWISQAGRPDGYNVNNSTGFCLVGHEIEHNVGSEHTSGGIMNTSSNTSRGFFRL